jgi:hypothetical protein
MNGASGGYSVAPSQNINIWSDGSNYFYGVEGGSEYTLDVTAAAGTEGAVVDCPANYPQVLSGGYITPGGSQVFVDIAIQASYGYSGTTTTSQLPGGAVAALGDNVATGWAVQLTSPESNQWLVFVTCGR